LFENVNLSQRPQWKHIGNIKSWILILC